MDAFIWRNYSLGIFFWMMDTTRWSSPCYREFFPRIFRKVPPWKMASEFAPNIKRLCMTKCGPAWKVKNYWWWLNLANIMWIQWNLECILGQCGGAFEKSWHSLLWLWSTRKKECYCKNVVKDLNLSRNHGALDCL